MSSSVLRNVIQPKQQPPPGAKAGVNETGDTGTEMELILSVLVENVPVAMALFDQEMRYMVANRQWLEEFGLQTVQPLIGRSQYEVFPSLHAGWRQVYDRALQGHVVRSEHDALAGPDGRRIIYRWEVRPWRRQKNASVGGVMVTCEKFAAPVDTADGEEGQAPPTEAAPPLQPAGVLECALPMVLLDDQGIVHQANAAAVELCLARGFQEGESSFWDIFCNGRDTTSLKQQTLATMVRLTALPATAAQLLVVREKAPEGAEQCPSRWLLSPMRSQDGASRFTALGLADLPMGDGPQKMTVHINPPNLPALASAVAAVTQPVAAADAGPANLELRRLQDDLSRARQELRTLHEAERTFIQREARIRHYLEALPCGVLVLDELGTPTFQNEHVVKLLGRPIQKTETVEHWLAAACPNPEHRDQVAALWRDDVWRRQLTRTFSLATADGLLKELEFKPVPLSGGALLVSIQDATETCRHEEQLRATEAKFRTLLHESAQAIVLTDKSGAVFEVNPGAEALLGHAKSELRRYPLDTWLDPQSGSARREMLRSLQSKGERFGSLPVTILQPGGPSVSAVLQVAQVVDAEQEVHCTIHFLQRTPQPKPPVAAPDAEVPAPRAADAGQAPGQAPTPSTVAVPLLQTNVNGRVCSWSDRAAELFEFTAEEAVGMPLHQLFRPSDASGLYADLAGRSAEPFVVPFFRKGGHRGSCRLIVKPRGMGAHDFELIEEQIAAAPPADQSVSADLPEPVAEQAQLAAPESAPQRHWPFADLQREKLLLSETHHRIKNHLQIISSLLNLELNTITDEQARSALRSSQNRVRAIGALHQHLYQLALGNNEAFGQFAAELVEKLRDCYQVPAERVGVQLEVEEGPIQQEWLMPLALTLNETLSNCFEHAFPHESSGLVRVQLGFGPEGGEFVISDDGVGLPDGFQLGEGAGLGLKILSVFAEQMRGQLLVNRGEEAGIEIRLRFPIASADI